MPLKTDPSPYQDEIDAHCDLINRPALLMRLE